jgi:antitoxin CptB
MIIVENQKRRQWRCRRGMLELDLILQGFLTHGFVSLDSRKIEAFDALLESHDTDLLAWLMGHATPNDKELQEIVHLIRTQYQTQAL